MKALLPKPRRNRMLLIPLGLLALLGVLALFPSRQSRFEETSGRPQGGTRASAGSTPDLRDYERLLPSRVSTASAPAVVLPNDERAEELARHIRDAMAAQALQAAAPVAMPPIRTQSAPDPRLIPKQTRLAENQLRALNRLRWRSPGKTIEWRTGSAQPTLTFLAGRLLEPAAARPEPGHSLAATTAREFLRHNSEVLALSQPDQELKLRDESTDTLGYTQLRFDQNYAGLAVWPGGIMVQTDPHGHVTLMTGAYFPTPAQTNLDPSLPVEAAERIARTQRPEMRLARKRAVELLIFAPHDTPTARLAWHFDLRASAIQQWDIFVDAHDGTVLATTTQVATAAATGSGIDSKGQTRTLDLWRHTDNQYYLVNAAKPMFDPTSSPPNLNQSRGVIAVLDLLNGVEPDVAASVHSKSGSPNGPWRPDAVSAATNLSKVYDFYQVRFNRKSVDGRGGSMTGVVNMNQANAFSDFQTLTMTFGNTDVYAEALDVVAHEMTHSVISTTSKLVYRNQSGALNESYADVLGESCEAHFGTGTPDWKMGTALREQGRALDDPSSKISALGVPFPDRMGRFIVTDIDAGGVHINSSITNHAFYLLAQGLTGAIGLDHALQIFYRAVTTKLNPNSQFVDSRLACVASAKELYGDASTQATKTAEAFDRVEIFDQQATPPPVATPEVDALDSTLFIFPSGGGTFLGRREAALGDNAAGVFLGDNGQPTPVMPGKKPAATGNGATGLCVTPNADAAFINTLSGAETFFNFAGQIESVGMSADGTVQAYVLKKPNGQPDKRIYVFDSKTNQTKTYDAVQPLTDQTSGAFANTILAVDALDLTPDGRYIYYDAVNRLSFPGGGFIDTYSIYFIDRKTDTIRSLVPPIPGVNVGNPSLGQTRPNLITFDVTDANGLSFIYATDLSTGVIQPVALLAAGATVPPGWPGFSGDDTAIVYTNYSFNGPYLESQPVQADGLTANGLAFPWLFGSNPGLGLIYRRGTFSGLPQLTINATDGIAAEPSDPATFVVSRTGPTAEPLPFSFVLNGTGTNGVDFSEIELSGQIPAGATNVTLTLQPIDDAVFEGSEQVVITLSEALHYVLGAPSSATASVQDNDTLTFASWAAGHGLGASDVAGDPDGDGRPNLVEYALGSNPKGLNTVPNPQLTVSGDQATFAVFRSQNSTDITYLVEVSSDLKAANWSSGATQTTTLENSTNLLRVRLNATLPAAPQNFVRLRITRP